MIKNWFIIYIGIIIKGYGTKLVNECIRISKEAGYSKIAVISGVGVRNYYRKFGWNKTN